MKHPNLDVSKFCNTVSTYNANKIGDKIPPCLTPASKGTAFDNLFFYLTFIIELENQSCKTLMIW